MSYNFCLCFLKLDLETFMNYYISLQIFINLWNLILDIWLIYVNLYLIPFGIIDLIFFFLSIIIILITKSTNNLSHNIVKVFGVLKLIYTIIVYIFLIIFLIVFLFYYNNLNYFISINFGNFEFLNFINNNYLITLFFIIIPIYFIINYFMIWNIKFFKLTKKTNKNFINNMEIKSTCYNSNREINNNLKISNIDLVEIKS